MWKRFIFWLHAYRCCKCQKLVAEADIVDVGMHRYMCSPCWNEILRNRPKAPLPPPPPPKTKKCKCKCSCEKK